MAGRLRSRTIRAAALVGLGLTAGCDEPPPSDTSAEFADRLASCEAAHRRLGADPANCAALEKWEQASQAATAPRFLSLQQCEMRFGADACDAQPGALPRVLPWHPTVAGWNSDPESAQAMPVVRDRNNQLWMLRNPISGDSDRSPLAVNSVEASPSITRSSLTLARLVPQYADRAGCEQEWGQCEGDPQLPNRFASQAACEQLWTECQVIARPAMETAATAGASSSSGTGSGYHGSSGFWWYRTVGYTEPTGYRPRYQGWGWTADYTPTATYRSANGVQAWDSSARQLSSPRNLVSSGGGSTGRASAGTTSISRAGFGSTGSSISAGG